jgi:hypothetical protein
MKRRILNFGLLILSISVFSSCKKYLDVNDDPNSPTTASAELVLPAAQAQIAGSVNGDYGILGGIWSQHWSQSNASSQYKDEDAYAIQNGDYNVAWRDLYSDCLIDLKFVKEDASAKGNWTGNLIATCLEGFTYQILADLYDEIPYTEALQGEGNFIPKFDKGQTVYDGIIASIDAALEKDFAASTNTGYSTDFVFGSLGVNGQTEKWIQFANTLKLKLYLRQIYKNPSVSTKIAELLAQDNFLTSDAAINKFVDEPNRSYPLFETDRRQLNTTTNLRGSQTLVSFLKANNDDRFNKLFDQNPDAIFSIPTGGFNIPTDDLNPSKVLVATLKPTQAFFFFSVEEVNFLVAEANGRTGNFAQAKDAYESGVKNSFSRYGFNGSSFIQAGGKYEYPSLAADFETVQLKSIMMQKWVANVYNGIESFFDFNRTHYPSISAVAYDDEAYVAGEMLYSLEGISGGKFPKRLPFPDVERQRNSNTPDEVSLFTKVWWDVKP